MEVLLSLGIMSVALLGLLSVLVTGLRSEHSSSQRVAAQDLASQIMGRTCLEIERLDENLAADFWTTDYDQAEAPFRQGREDEFRYLVLTKAVRRKDTGQRLGDSPGAHYNRLVKIDVLVRWQAPQNKGKADFSEVSYSRLLNRRRG